MKRLAALLVAAMIIGLTAWWWGLDDPAWACGASEQISECLSSATLDLDGLNLERPRLGLRGFAVSPDGSVAVAAIESTSADGGNDRAVVAVFDLLTGEHRRTLTTVEGPDGEALAEHPTFSGDGSLLAVTVRGADFSALLVLEAATGAERARLLTTNGDEVAECFGRLAFSPDNRSIQCGRLLIDIDSGEVDGFPDDENQFASTTGRTAFSFDDQTARLYGSEVRVGPFDESLPGFRIAVPDLDLGRSKQLAFSPDTSLLAVSIGRSGPGWSLRSPVRSRPGGSLAVLDVENRQILAVFDMGQGFDFISWSADGRRLAGITGDLTVMSFDGTAWS